MYVLIKGLRIKFDGTDKLMVLEIEKLEGAGLDGFDLTFGEIFIQPLLSGDLHIDIEGTTFFVDDKKDFDHDSKG